MIEPPGGKPGHSGAGHGSVTDDDLVVEKQQTRVAVSLLGVSRDDAFVCPGLAIISGNHRDKGRAYSVFSADAAQQEQVAGRGDSFHVQRR